MDTAMAAPNRRVDMWFEETAPQNRWTVGFRFILLIPQVVVLFFLGLATVVVAIIGWFGALFTGRLPEWAHTFMSGVLRWSIRVNAYAFLLTDAYPPFAFEDEAYPARPILPEPGPLNRWAVGFRWVLVVPASVFAQVVANGLSIPLLFVAWFIVLISGRMPPQLYWAYAALVRYEARVYGYFLMLTAEYAWGMLGDPGAPAPIAGVPFTDPAAPPPPPAPAPGAEPATGPVSPPSQEPPQWPAPVPPPTAQPDIGSMPPPSAWERAVPAAGAPDEPRWGTLVLAGAARNWMIFAIVWGSVVTVTQGSIQAAIRGHSTASTAQQFNTASDDIKAANNAIITAATAAGTCTSMASVRPSQLDASSTLTKLANDLHGMNLPDNAAPSAAAVESDALQLAGIYNRLAASTDCSALHTIGRTSTFATLVSSYPEDTVRFLTVLQADES